MPDEFLVYSLLCLFLALVHVAGPLTKREGKSSHRYNCSSLLILVWKSFSNLLKDIVGDLLLHFSVQCFICYSVNDLYNLLVCCCFMFFLFFSAPSCITPRHAFSLCRLRHTKNKGVQQLHASSEAISVGKVARHPPSRHVVACDD